MPLIPFYEASIPQFVLLGIFYALYFFLYCRTVLAI